MRGFCYAQAMNAARVKYTLEHAGYQLDPLKVTEMLPLREGEYGIVPTANEGLDARRATLAARLLAPKGGDKNNIKNALLTMLGAEFVGYVPTAFIDASISPPACGQQPMLLAAGARLPKLVTILDLISIGLGSPQWVRYESLSLPSIPEQSTPTLPPTQLLIGEEFVVEPGHNVSQERVTILDLRELVPGQTELRAAFNLPHKTNTLASNLTFPYWISTKRYNIAALKPSSAADPETRRKVNELLSRMVRAVSTWSIVQEDPSNLLHTGVFRADTSGADTQTCEDALI